MSIQSMLLLLAFGILAVQGVLVLFRRRNYSALTRVLFLALLASELIWILMMVFFASPGLGIYNLTTAQIQLAAAVMIAVFWLGLILSFRARLSVVLLLTGVAFFVSAVIIAAYVIDPSLMFVEVGAGHMVMGNLFPVYAGVGTAIIVCHAAVMTYNIVSSRTRIERSRYIYVFLASLIAGVVAVFFDLYVPLIWQDYTLFWLGPFGFSFFAVLVFYAMYKYQLFGFQFEPKVKLDDELTSRVAVKAISNVDIGSALEQIMGELMKADRVDMAAAQIKFEKDMGRYGQEILFLDEGDFNRVVTAARTREMNVFTVDNLASDDSIYKLMKMRNVAAMVVFLDDMVQETGVVSVGSKQDAMFSKTEIASLVSIAAIISSAYKNSRYFVKNIELQKLDIAKDELLSIASHNLRSPLSILRGYLELVESKKDELSDEARGYVKSSLCEIKKMSHIIDDFLTISRIQTGNFELLKTTLEFNDVVMDEMTTLAMLGKKAEKELSLRTSGDKFTCFADESLIRQCVYNLVDNAIFYAGEGSEIEILLSAQDDEVKFEVADHGIGVPENEREALFKKFARASNAKKERPNGTGTGLYMVKRIIQAHGGEVFYRPNEGGGSVFGFILPMA